jgi:hypothetical protein
MKSQIYLKYIIALYAITIYSFAKAEKPYTLDGAKPFGRDLKIKKSLVPQFDLIGTKTLNIKNQGRTVKIKILPHLDLGTEALLKDSGTNLILPTVTAVKKPSITKAQPLIDIISVLKKNHSTNIALKTQEATDILKTLTRPDLKFLKIPELQK